MRCEVERPTPAEREPRLEGIRVVVIGLGKSGLAALRLAASKGARVIAADLRPVSDLAGVAPALVFTAGFDPLRDEGQAYAKRLSAAGVKTIHREFDTLIHGFVGMRGALQAAARAMDDMVAGLRHELAQLGR